MGPVRGTQAATPGGCGPGTVELNVQLPRRARNRLQSIALLSSACRLFAEKCVDGIEANREVCEHHGESTLAMATALNPYIRYDHAPKVIQHAIKENKTLTQVVLERGLLTEAEADKALDVWAMTRPGIVKK